MQVRGWLRTGCSLGEVWLRGSESSIHFIEILSGLPENLGKYLPQRSVVHIGRVLSKVFEDLQGKRHPEILVEEVNHPATATFDEHSSQDPSQDIARGIRSGFHPLCPTELAGYGSVSSAGRDVPWVLTHPNR